MCATQGKHQGLGQHTMCFFYRRYIDVCHRSMQRTETKGLGQHITLQGTHRNEGAVHIVNPVLHMLSSRHTSVAIEI